MRRLLVTWVVFVLAWAAVSSCELIFHDRHEALLRTDISRRSDLAGTVLALLIVVTTWAWFRTRPGRQKTITVKQLRDLGR